MSGTRRPRPPLAAPADEARRAATGPGGDLSPVALAPLLAGLAEARGALRARRIEERARVIERVSALWLADEPRLARAAERIAGTTGYAAPMVAECLTRTFRAWTGTALAGLVDEATGDLATLVEFPTDPAGRGGETTALRIAPGLVVAILAQNTPGLAVAPVFSALLLGAAVIVKSSRGEPEFAPLLLTSIAELDPPIGAACAARLWAGGDAAVEEPLFAAADRVVVYGGADAIAAVRARAGDRTIARGPRTSVAVVAGGDEVPTPAPADFPERTARVLARAVAFLDQRGCLSPQFVLVDAGLDAGALAERLALELAAVEREWPRRRLGLADAAAFRRAVDESEAEFLAGRCAALLGGIGTPWAVVLERDGELRPGPLDRFVRILPYRGAEELRRILARLRDGLECVGLDAPPSARGRLERICGEAGAVRICPIEDMQDPPAAWQAGGRPPLASWWHWSVVERGDSVPAVPGHPATDLRARFLRHVAQTSDAPRAIEVVRARGSWVYDAGGRAWLDLLAGIGVASIGHAHPAVARAVAAQARRFTHVMVYGEDVLAPQVDLATRLASRLPAPLSMTYFTNSGAEAIEGALKLARKATGRSRVLAFEGAYHGDTTGALALGGNPFYREPFEPLLPFVERLPWNTPEALERIDRRTAAVFAEPIQAEAGVRIPDPEFLPRLAARCREVGALLVLDEVVTALGRTGRWFAFEHWPGATPDVLVLAKALGAGLPLGAFVASPERMAALSHDPPLGHITTFGGNPVSCAAALAGLDVLEAERLPERAARLGETLRRALGGLVGRGGLVEVRGLGLLLGLEFDGPVATADFVARCRDRGVLLGWTLHHDRVVRLAPPLTLLDEELDLAVGLLGEALGV